MAKSLHSPAHRRLAKLLRQLREEADMTQAQLAAHLRRPQSFVSNVEAGERRVDLIELEQIAKAVGMSLVDLVQRYSGTK